jgi:hypothetical protein
MLMSNSLLLQVRAWGSVPAAHGFGLVIYADL